ncbi:MAG TPA: M10 family metallopeptidase C-terminal domain-containing protein [Allosphingosinicella sp.]|jgi:VCBS repeat-containing protein
MILHYDRLGTTVTLTAAGASGNDPVMARLASGGFVLVWREENGTSGQSLPYDIRVQLFGPGGAPAGASFLAASTGLNEFEPSVTPLAGGGFAVAWRETDFGSSLLKIQAYDSAGSVVGAPISIAGANPMDPAIAQLADGSLAITWVSDEPTAYVHAVRVQRYDLAGAPIGETATLSDRSVGDFSDPQITALGSGGFVVTWFYLKGAPNYQRTSAAQVFGADGTALAPAFDVSGATSGDQRSPQVAALAGGGFVIIWSDEPSQSLEGEIRGRIYADNGAPVGPEFTVSENSTGMQVVPRVAALASGGFAVSWSGWDRGRTLETDAINVRVFDSAGQSVGNQFRADSPSGVQGASSIVELGSGELAVAWHSQGRIKLQLFGDSAGDGVSDIRLSTQIVKEQGVGGLAVATLDAPGGAVNAPTAFTLIGDSSGAFAIVGDTLVLTDPRKLDFETQPTVQLTLRAVDASGIAFDKVLTVQVQDQAELPGAFVAGAEFRANTTTSGFQHSPMAAKLAGGGFVLVWYDGGGISGRATAQLFDSSGGKIGGELTIGTNAMSSSVAALGDGFVATWVTESGGVATIRGQIYGATGAAVGGPFVVANTSPQGFSLDPNVEALSGGGFVVTWSAPGGADSSLDTVFQRFDSSGAALGPLTVANASTTGAQIVTAVAALSDGGFLLVWNDAPEGMAGAVRARRFAADGTAAGDSFFAPAAPEGLSGVAAGQANGSFAIAWISSDRQVMLQLFDPSGARVGGEIAVATVGFSEWVGQPAIEAQAGGGYIVSWARDLTASRITNTDIVAQRIGPGGELVGGLIQVNSTVYRAQQTPTIAADRNGGFLIAWSDQSDLDGGSLTEVKARVFTDVAPLALARNDSFRTDEATALAGLSVFSNNGSGADGAPASGALMVVAVNGSAASVGQSTLLASGARLTLQSDGSFAYDPNGAFDSLYDPVAGSPSSAVDRFTYTLAGGSTATVAVTISGLGGVTLVGGAGPDRLTGTPADDRLDGGAGSDEMIGAAGNDIYFVDNPGDVVTENAGEGTDEIRTALASYSLAGLANVENLTATSDSAHDFRGNSANNIVTGGAGSDFIRLQDGGDDTGIGGAGNDVFLFGAALTSTDQVNGGAGTDQIAIQGDYWGAKALTLGSNLVSVENIAILPGNDTRFGDSGTSFYDYSITVLDSMVAAGVQLVVDANRLRVGEDFTFNGSAETDGSFFIYGGGGDDRLTGGAKNDVFIFGGQGQWGSGDVVVGGAGIDQLALRGNYTITFGAGQLVGVEQIGMVSAQDTRYGALGSSYSYDLTMVDGNVDSIQMTVDASPLRAGETLKFNGSAEDDGSFRVFGGRDNDTIVGSQNGDILAGNAGADTLTGGGGADVFRYLSTSDSTAAATDRILDFAAGTDKFDLSRIDADTLTAGDQAFSWIGSNAFSGSAGQLRAYQDGANWVLQGDTDGNGSADFVLILSLNGPTPLSASDFAL